MQTQTTQRHSVARPGLAQVHTITAARCFDGALQLFDHGHITSARHARLFRTGELCIPGHAPEYVAIRFLNFQFNAMQDRSDAVYTVLRSGQYAGEFFASAFRHLWL